MNHNHIVHWIVSTELFSWSVRSGSDWIWIDSEVSMAIYDNNPSTVRTRFFNRQALIGPQSSAPFLSRLKTHRQKPGKTKLNLTGESISDDNWTNENGAKSDCCWRLRWDGWKLWKKKPSKRNWVKILLSGIILHSIPVFIKRMSTFNTFSKTHNKEVVSW